MSFRWGLWQVNSCSKLTARPYRRVGPRSTGNVASPRLRKTITGQRRAYLYIDTKNQSRKKDDRLDAQTLARLARIDPELLCPVKHRSAQAQADLAVIRARARNLGERHWWLA